MPRTTPKSQPSSFTRRRTRTKAGYIFISYAELEEENIVGPFAPGYEIIYNDVSHLLCGLSIGGILIQPRR